MLRGEPATWAQFLPGYGGVRMLIDGGLTSGFDATQGLANALAWLVGLTVVVAFVLRQRPVARGLLSR